MKIGFITTIDTNIGDDFIRTGIENLILSVPTKNEVKFSYVNKHEPETALSNLHPSRILQKLAPAFRGKKRICNFLESAFNKRLSIYCKQDLIVQSGAPFLWPNCHYNEWAESIWYNTIGKLKHKVPTLNLAIGSCYPWQSKSEIVLGKGEAKYASDVGSFCAITTTRDKLAHQLLSSIGVKNTLLPCTAFFVDNSFQNPSSGDYILINYMEGGGHFDWGQEINKNFWEATIREVVRHFQKKHEVRFICHSDKEVGLAKELMTGSEICYPKSVPEYLDCIRNAKLGINNRMHASVAMASVGVPSISVCTDTRLLMLANLGLPNLYVKDVKSEKLIEIGDTLISTLHDERQRLFALKKQSYNSYRDLLTPFLNV